MKESDLKRINKRRLNLIRQILNNGGELHMAAYSYILTDSGEIIKVRPLKADGPVFADKLEVDSVRSIERD